MDPNLIMTSVLRGKFGHRQTQGQWPCKVGGRFEDRLPQTKEAVDVPEAGSGKEGPFPRSLALLTLGFYTNCERVFPWF